MIMISGMEGFGLLVGHLVGDYLIQNDWMAKNKANPLAGFSPKGYCARRDSAWRSTKEQLEQYKEYETRLIKEFIGHFACTIHCLLYTLAIYLFSLSRGPGVYSWIPWWGLLLYFSTHWIIDRFRLARKSMDYTGQRDFATGPLTPWSIIIVDNTWHLLTLYLIALLS